MILYKLPIKFWCFILFDFSLEKMYSKNCINLGIRMILSSLNG